MLAKNGNRYTPKPVVRIPTGKLGWMIRRGREKLGITSKEFADRAGFSKGHAHNLEYNPNWRPTSETMIAIAESLQ